MPPRPPHEIRLCLQVPIVIFLSLSRRAPLWCWCWWCGWCLWRWLCWCWWWCWWWCGWCGWWRQSGEVTPPYTLTVVPGLSTGEEEGGHTPWLRPAGLPRPPRTNNINIIIINNINIIIINDIINVIIIIIIIITILLTYPSEKHHEGVEVEVTLAVALRVVVRPDDREHPQTFGEENYWAG